MSEKNQCSCQNGLKLVFSCSGAADTAELADRVARQINRGGDAKMYCLAGVGGDVDTIVSNVRAAEQLLVIDGCDTDCAAKLLRRNGFDSFIHLRVTDRGFEKGKTMVTEDKVEHIAREAMALLKVGKA